MTRTSRLAAGALVVALVAVAGSCATTGRTPVPTPLVGRWVGGAHGNGPWIYEFAPDGGYRAWPAADPAALNTGTVTVDDDTVTFSNGGAPVTVPWRLAGRTLVLDGQRYARAPEGP
jgi:hypothetical protein